MLSNEITYELLVRALLRKAIYIVHVDLTFAFRPKISSTAQGMCR
jgi:hypothetical protein